MKKHILFLAFVACIMFACKPDLEKPTVVSSPISQITETSAVAGGEVISDGEAEVTSRGVCWSVDSNPTIENDKTIDGEGVGSFQSNLSDLSQNTTYYVRAYATNSEGTSYGEEVSFTTLEIIDDEDNSDEDDTDDSDEEDDDNNDDTDDEEDEIVVELAFVTTLSVSEITETSAVVGCEVTSDGGAEVTSRGVCWSVDSNPTIENYKTIDGEGVGSYQSVLSDLSQNTTYYVRAYATNSEGTAYGEEVTFKTLEEIVDDGTSINGYECVDLGLPSGLKWAAHNIGAGNPYELGDYFAWGETSPKSDYSEANSQTNGLPLTNISGDINYDAATTIWGASWRIPTREEMEELRDNCTWEWTTDGETPGFKVTGNNGNHIFLPASGFVFVTTPYFVEQYGYYWTSVSGTDNYLGAFSMCFASETIDVAWYFRYAGLTIRPVSN